MNAIRLASRLLTSRRFSGACMLTLSSSLHGLHASSVQDSSATDTPTPKEVIEGRAVLVGRVLGADGAPRSAAVVVTSAGGKAVSAADGTYRLELGGPLQDSSVQVTAVVGSRSGSGSLVASTLVSGLALGATTPVNPLTVAASTGCAPDWLPTFGMRPGVGAQVLASVAFDDGSGPALFVAGDLSFAGSTFVNHIAKWDGSQWSALGSGTNGPIAALSVFDDGLGGGPALYAGGSFTNAGGVSAPRIAKWDGAGWSPVGGGIGGQIVTALAVYTDPTSGSPSLYAGGWFGSAGGVSAQNIAKWDGSTWSALSSGVDGTVWSLSTYAAPTGGGVKLCVGGEFFTAGGGDARSIACWDGTSWSALGTGIQGRVRTLTVYDDAGGAGAALYAGGVFQTAGQVAANFIARWNGTNWSPLGSGMDGEVRSLLVFHDSASNGAELYAGGSFGNAGGLAASRIARWNGVSWSPLGTGLDGGQGGIVSALAAFDAGSGPALYAGGVFQGAGGKSALNLASWKDSAWSALGDGLDGIVMAQTVHDDGLGGGPALYVAGVFSNAGGAQTNRIAKWDGQAWSALGSGIDSGVYALTTFDDGLGSGPQLIAGGAFTTAGGASASRVARWNGATWSALGTGVDGDVLAFAVHDDGQGDGPALYAAGAFTHAGTVSAPRIARWNGLAWQAVGPGSTSVIQALAVYDDGLGGGPALYAGGQGGFATPGGSITMRIARLNGSTWSALGTGADNHVHALAVYDDGSGQGPALYAGGNFTQIGGVNTGRIARWNGTSWSALGSGISSSAPAGPPVSALAVFDDGTGGGPALYAAGYFQKAGGLNAASIARWNGANWSALGAGISNTMFQTVRSLAVFDDGSGGGNALYVGGTFTVSPAGDSYLAKWGCPGPSISSLPGCAGNPATLSAVAATAPLGMPLPLRLNGAATSSGLGLLYLGASGVDGAGCGLQLPGIGELLLALVPAPVGIASGALVGGQLDVAVGVPNLPALAGLIVHLQGVALDALAVPAIELSNALAVKLGN